MPESTDVADFAVTMRMLKERADRTYGALAKRTGVSSSTLHRYCSGDSVPLEFLPLERFARACGASREELRELQRRWVLADAVRTRGVTGAVAGEVGAERTAMAARPAGAALLAGGGPGVLAPGVAVLAGGGQGVFAGGGQGALAGDATPVASLALPDGTRTAGLGGLAVVLTPGAGERLVSGPGWRWRRLLRTWQAAAAVAVLCAGAGAAGTAVAMGDRSPGPAAAAAGSGGGPLLSDGCPVVVAMGEQDGCVREVQRLLAAAGTSIKVDSQFGPETRRRVTAFQVLAGMSPNGIVDERTKRALYAGTVSMRTWPKSDVERRIRAVFPEVPGDAVAIARCQSFLDPHHILSNEDGSRNWGLFQLWDRRVAELGGTPRLALDPEWNIQAAHQLWLRHKDFRDWPGCAGALGTSS